jgi:hypothetical protein
MTCLNDLGAERRTSIGFRKRHLVTSEHGRTQSAAGSFGLLRETRRLGGVATGIGLAESSGALAGLRAGRLAGRPNRGAFCSSAPSTSQKSQ